MKKIILLLISLGFFIPGYSFAATQNTHIEWTYDYEPTDGRTLAGYSLYQEGVKICTNNTPTDRTMDCTFESEVGTFDFTLTAFCTDGYESPHSPPYTFTLTTPPEQELLAVFNTNPTPLIGDIPFFVSFDATTSTGDITSYNWNFGDNSSGSGSQTTHTYTTPGTFSATLTVTSANGTTRQESVLVTVTPAPIAIITTTPTTLSGNVPFTVSLDASTSTGDISSYSWNFGDNNSGSGSQTTHTFTTPGTFNTILTVTSTNGSTSQQSVTVNVLDAPLADFTTNPVSLTGDIPFTVSYDASSSTGNITSFAWDFGDNSSGSGSLSTHTYNTAGTFNTVLTTTSSNGTTSQKTVTINATTPLTPPGNYNIHLEWKYDYQPAEGRTLVGYNLYKEGVKVCTNNNPTDRAMNCSFESQAGTFNFTLTAFDTDGYESSHSSPYTFTLSSPSDPAFAANIVTAPTVLSGNAPLTVSFDGSTSIGAVSYAWAFGDGDTANGSHTNHTFTAAGTFTTTLSITDAQGLITAKNVVVTVNETSTQNTLPTAIIESSTAMGDAPLAVSFDGSGSHDNEEPISSYLWNFGDGSPTTTGSTATHSYTVAGTYSAALTVTDSQGATNTTSTPVIITGQTVENQAPTARLTASTTSGTAPLQVVFDGSTSTDPENSTLTYSWNFGDGSSAQGNTTTHTYTSTGIFTATLTVTDDIGAASSTTTTITTTDETPVFQIELGEVEIDHKWLRIDFSDPFINPVVVAGPPSRNDSDPCVVRIRNITTTGFDIRIQEWDYLDGTHAKETVAYLVMEQGNFTLDDGTMIEAGQFTSTDSNFQAIQFNTTFTTEPVVMTSIATFNEEDAVTGRLRNISTTSFEHKTQQQESLNAHGNETGTYIAWEPSNNSIDTINIIVDKTEDKVRSRWYTVDYGEELSELPIFFGTMQSQDGSEASTVRYTNKTNTEVQIMIEEEQSLDDETWHTSETVGYFLFFSNSTL